MVLKIEVSRGDIKRHDYITDELLSSMETKEEIRKYFGLMVEQLLEIVDRSPC